MKREKRAVRISVAISTRNRADVLERCLQALLADDDVPSEIIVVDQSEEDLTRQVVERLDSPLTHVRYIKQEGSGLGASQNLAVGSASNEFVAIIDDDCVPGADWIWNISQTFEGSPDLGLITGRILPLGPPSPGLYPVASRTSQVRREFRGRTGPWHVGSGNNFAVRKSAFIAIGGCDERLGPGSAAMGGVDMDLFYRMLRSGVAGRYEPSVVVYHEQQSYEQRMKRRPMYGFGTGAAMGFWLRDADYHAFVLLAEWVLWRAARMVSASVRGDFTRVREENVMLASTFRGLAFGFRSEVT